jgi:hypothetical protein
MSTPNHNILYFFSVCRIRPLNMGICLWKAQNCLSGRGFGAKLAPEPVQNSGRLSDLASIKSLASTGPIYKTQNWCRSREVLCELWTIAPNHLMTSKVGAVHGTRPATVGSDRPGRSDRQAILCTLERRASARRMMRKHPQQWHPRTTHTPERFAAMLFGW